ncbi:MAG: ABC transporter substrate-binding protein [Desulfobulbaceae bacterium]|nr:ABC transporter substrate-binding protein [Desulfobulbaceae bacterium]
MKKISHLILVILLIVFLPGCSEEQQAITPSGKTIKIGIVGPMSGPEKAMGEESLEGIQAALHMHPYLKNGDGIKLVVADDQNEPELTVKAFRKLIDSDKVSAVILLSTSASALAVNSIADSHQVPVLVLLATHPEISKNTKFVSQICFDNTFQGKVAALFVCDELLIDRVAVFKNPDSFYSSSLADEFIRKFRSIEGQVTEVISIASETVDYDAILTHLREQNVQLLYLPVAAENVIAISRALREMDWDPMGMGGDGLLTNVLALHPEEVDHLDGFLAIDLYSSTIEATPYGKKAGKVFYSLYETRNSTYPAAGIEGIALLMDAMNRCHNPADSACINTMVHDTVDFEGFMGKITIQPNGKALRPLIVNRIRGEHLEFVVKVY